MFKKAQIKLTFVYSALFLILFWSFSFGIYQWMNSSFGEGYISQVHERQGTDANSFTSRNAQVVTIAGDVALDQLLRILLNLNGALVFVVPVASWFLAKRTLAPVQKMHEQQKQFVTDASHELRTPLSIISGEIEVTLKKKRGASEYLSTLVSTKEEVDRLSQLAENLLFLAREDNLKKSISFQTIDITDVLNSVVESLKPKSDTKRIPITLQTDTTSSPIVMGNEELLQQLFYNLLNNAITYTPEKGKIKITLTEGKDTISVAIKDTGIGISKEDQAKIFNRFYRVDSSRSQTKGYGLGLPIVQAVIAKHHGQLHLISQPKKGSLFTVTFPKQ